MSRAEELLDSLTEEQIMMYGVNPVDEPHIVIESDKSITVPDDLRHIAVQGEHNIETVTFDCPRYWDGHDLSQMIMRIVYQRPDGHREPHLVENLRVDEADENTIHFDWTVSGNVTAVKGNISFMVCAKLSDSEGNREREWHTRLSQDLIVDEGMECSGEEIVEQNPDIIEAILVQLDDLKNASGVSDEQVANAVAAYLEENPIEAGVDEEEVRNIVAAYLQENPPEGDTVTEEQIETAVANYMTQHPIEAEPGGHYTPVVTQPTDNTMQVSFTPSKADMPPVESVTVNLPVGEGSGQNLDYSAATNKPSINGVTLEGNKTAEQLGIGQPTNEQVSAAVEAHLIKNPVAAGATPEQVAQLEFATNTDAALFATLETGSLYELDLSKFYWYDGVYLHWNTTGLNWGRHMTKAGHHYLDNGWIELRKGDILITNADTDEKAGANHYLSCLIQKKTSQTGLYNSGTLVMQGRGAYDGLYRTYTATDDVEYLRVAYQYDVDYDVHFYVARARTENAVPFELYGGYLKPTTGEVIIVSETNWGVTGYNYIAVSSLMTISAPGKFLLVDNVRIHDERGGYCWCRYTEDGTMTYGMLKARGNKGYYIIPLFDETEHIRFSCHLTDTPYQYITAQLVDAEYLIRHGYVTKLAGKKMVGFGDSYIQGHNQGEWRTALYRIAEEHQMKYTAFGHNGWGICRGPLTPTTLADVITEELSGLDADYIIVWAGRNDYFSQAPIGTNDDMADMSVNYLQRTFKGSLNYICKFLVENYPGKKVAFFTPWYFPSTLTEGETHKPVEYIDAIKEICGIWGIPVLDCARDCGIHVKSEVFRSQYFLSADDVSHLNWDGACLFADGPADDWLMLL